jgi:hypothetical protein
VGLRNALNVEVLVFVLHGAGKMKKNKAARGCRMQGF